MLYLVFWISWSEISHSRARSGSRSAFFLGKLMQTVAISWSETKYICLTLTCRTSVHEFIDSSAKENRPNVFSFKGNYQFSKCDNSLFYFIWREYDMKTLCTHLRLNKCNKTISDEHVSSGDICRICHMGGYGLITENYSFTLDSRNSSERASTPSNLVYLGPLISACK